MANERLVASETAPRIVRQVGLGGETDVTVRGPAMPTPPYESGVILLGETAFTVVGPKSRGKGSSNSSLGPGTGI